MNWTRQIKVARCCVCHEALDSWSGEGVICVDCLRSIDLAPAKSECLQCGRIVGPGEVIIPFDCAHCRMGIWHRSWLPNLTSIAMPWQRSFKFRPSVRYREEMGKLWLRKWIESNQGLDRPDYIVAIHSERYDPSVSSTTEWMVEFINRKSYLFRWADSSVPWTMLCASQKTRKQHFGGRDQRLLREIPQWRLRDPVPGLGEARLVWVLDDAVTSGLTMSSAVEGLRNIFSARWPMAKPTIQAHSLQYGIQTAGWNVLDY